MGAERGLQRHRRSSCTTRRRRPSTGDQCIGVATAALADRPVRRPLGRNPSCATTARYGPDHRCRATTAAASTPTSSPITPATPSCSGRVTGTTSVQPTVIWSVPLDANLPRRPSGTPTQLLRGADATWQGAIIEGPDMVETQHDRQRTAPHDEQLLPLLLGQRRRRRRPTPSDGPAVPAARPSATAPRSRRADPSWRRRRACRGPAARRLPSAAGLGELRHGRRRAGRAPPSATSAAASGRCTWPDLTFASSGGAPVADAVHRTPRRPPARPARRRHRPSPGYWQVASDGGIFSFGGAQFYGSTGSIKLNKPVVGMAATANGGGYWLVASDGGVFAYGNAQFYGSTGSIGLNKPIIGLIPTIDDGRLLVDRQRRRRLRLRRRAVLRLHGCRRPVLSRHRRRAVLPRRRLLDGRRQRPGLQLRRCALRGPAVVGARRLPHHRHGADGETRTATGWPARTATWPTSATPRRTAPWSAPT